MISFYLKKKTKQKNKKQKKKKKISIILGVTHAGPVFAQIGS